MKDAYFVHQIKHTNGAWDKGIVVKATGETAKDNYDAALQGYHAYLGAYAYKNNADTDFVSCEITDEYGERVLWETWDGRPAGQ